MGRNTYKNGYIQDDYPGYNVLLNSPLVQFRLEALGEEFIQVAKGVFQAHDKGEDTLPVTYNNSFGIRHVHRLLIEAIQVYNDDPTAEWVEFGAHAGGKTRVLRYRVFGRTADILEARTRA